MRDSSKICIKRQLQGHTAFIAYQECFQMGRSSKRLDPKSDALA